LKNSKFPPKEKRLKSKKKLLLIWVKLSRVRIGSVWNRVRFGSGSGCPFSVHFGLGHYGSGLNWVRSFRVWVISGHATIRVSFGSGLVYFRYSGSNRFAPFRMSVRVSFASYTLRLLTLWQELNNKDRCGLTTIYSCSHSSPSITLSARPPLVLVPLHPPCPRQVVTLFLFLLTFNVDD